MRDTIRVSELSLWLKCRRRTFLSYEEGYDSISREAGIGTAFHTLVAGYYGGAHLIPEEQYQQVADLDPEDRLTVENMYDTYVEECETDGLDVGIETVAVERRLSTLVLVEPSLTLTGQIDHLYADPVIDGLVVQDTKTVASVFQTAQRDFQLMCYAWLAYTSGYNVRAIEHNIVKRNKRTGRAKPPFIQRNRHVLSHEEIESFGRSLGYIAQEYAAALEVADGDASHPILWAKGTNECSWSCPFASICGMLDDPEADWLGVLQSEYIKREEEPLYA